MGLDKPQTETIDGHVWVVTPFPGRPSNKYKWRLMTMVGPALSELLPALWPVIGALQETGGKPVNILDMKIDLSVIPKVVSSLAQHVAEDKLVDTMVELMAMSTRDSTPMDEVAFDRIFAGNDLELYQALWFIIRTNWPDFLKWVQERATGLSPKALPPATPQKPQPANATSKG